jgi:hypothetical protein
VYVSFFLLDFFLLHLQIVCDESASGIRPLFLPRVDSSSAFKEEGKNYGNEFPEAREL